MEADIEKKPEFLQTTLQLDIVPWSSSVKHILIIELTVPFEERMEEAYKCKRVT